MMLHSIIIIIIMGYVTSYEHSGFGDDPDHDADT